MSSKQTAIRHGGTCLLLMLLTACSGVTQRAPVTSGTPPGETLGEQETPAESSIKAVLYDQYRQWYGTPYRYGGLSKRGIDCSGLVYTIFKHKFDYELPRTAAEQARLGYSVPRDAIATGDLVFFRTGKKNHHVGIYLENGKFLHASTSDGVMLSNLNEHYWSARYWKTQRLAETVAER